MNNDLCVDNKGISSLFLGAKAPLGLVLEREKEREEERNPLLEQCKALI